MDTITLIKDIVKGTIDSLEKSYQILVLLAIFLVVSLFSGQYTKNTDFYKELRTLREIYSSLYVYSGIDYFLILCGVLACIGLLICYSKGVTPFCLRLISLVTSIILYYSVIVWLIFFDIFGYTGELNYIFPNLKITSSLSGFLGILNFTLGILFILFWAHLPIQAKKA